MNPSCWLDIPLPEKARCALVGTGTVGPLIARSSLTRTRQMSWRNLPSVRLSRRGWPEMVCAKCLQGALALAFYPRWGSVAQNISRPPQGSERPHRTLKQRESAVAHVTENHGPGCRQGAPGPSSSWPWGPAQVFLGASVVQQSGAGALERTFSQGQRHGGRTKLSSAAVPGRISEGIVGSPGSHASPGTHAFAEACNALTGQGGAPRNLKD